MDRIVAISDTTNAAIHALALAAARQGTISARDAAMQLHVSPTYFAKILQRLAGCGFLIPNRGVKGGYTLSKPPETISCLDVVTALEGELPQRECLFLLQSAIQRPVLCALHANKLRGSCELCWKKRQLLPLGGVFNKK